ncbi:MAG: hypothetical protein U0V54_15795 [Saprospiraceae bacterium]
MDDQLIPLPDEQEAMQLICQNLGVSQNQTINKDALIHLIADRVNELLETDKDLLLSYLYRLDISMKRINEMLKIKHIIPAHESIARLIFERQVERVKTKKKYKVPPIEDGWEF